VHFLLGETDLGFKWFETADSEHDGNLNMMLQDNELERVKDDPRFLEALKRVRLSRQTIAQK